MAEDSGPRVTSPWAGWSEDELYERAMDVVMGDRMPDHYPMADYECRHGHLSSDRRITCRCYPQRKESLLNELMEQINECKVDGCHRPYDKQKGKFGRLCVQHRDEARMNTAFPPPVIPTESNVDEPQGGFEPDEAIVDAIESMADRLYAQDEYASALARLSAARLTVLERLADLAEARDEMRRMYENLADVLPDWTGND